MTNPQRNPLAEADDEICTYEQDDAYNDDAYDNLKQEGLL